MELVVRKPEKTTIVGVTLLKSERGVTVTEMNVEAAGYTGGIRVGDVLLSVQGEPCTSPEQTSGVLRAARNVISVELLRASAASAAPPPADEGAGRPLGVVLVKEEPGTKVGLNMKPGGAGMMLSEVSKGGAAHKAGLKVGDVLLSVRGQLCTSPEQTGELLSAAEGQVLLFVERAPEKKGLFGKK